MVLTERMAFKLLKRYSIIGGVILVAVLIAYPLIGPGLRSDVHDFLTRNIGFLTNLTWIIFFSCSFSLCALLVWLSWDERHMEALNKPVSMLVAPDYYKGTKYGRTDIYKVMTSLQRLRNPRLDEDADGKNARLTDRQRPDTEEQSAADAHEKRRQTRIRLDHRVYDAADNLIKQTDRREDLTEGKHLIYRDIGTLDTEYTVTDGKMEGAYRSYYADGQVHAERHYRAGRLHGPYKAYDEFGVLFFDMEYRDGKKHGIENTYDKYGMLQYKDMYDMGQRINRKTYKSGEVVFDQDYEH